MNGINLPTAIVIPRSRYIDSGFYRLTEAEARTLCGGTLPADGYERRIAADQAARLKLGDHALTGRERVWVSRTIDLVDSKRTQVWSVRAYHH